MIGCLLLVVVSFFSPFLYPTRKSTHISLLLLIFYPRKKIKKRKKKGKSNPKCKKIHMKKAQKITQVDGKGPK
jgi:hypothetical protein